MRISKVLAIFCLSLCLSSVVVPPALADSVAAASSHFSCDQTQQDVIDVPDMPAPSELCEAMPITVGSDNQGRPMCDFGYSGGTCRMVRGTNGWQVPGCAESESGYCDRCIAMVPPRVCRNGIPTDLLANISQLAGILAYQSHSCDCPILYGNSCSGNCYVAPGGRQPLSLVRATFARDSSGNCRVRASYLVQFQCTGTCSGSRVQ